MTTPLSVEAYTDGSCKNNQSCDNIGGWGWIAYLKSVKTLKECCVSFSDWGGTQNTTNNRMELQAMAEFLEFCPRGNHVNVTIFSDSQYVLGGIIGYSQKEGVALNSKASLKSWVSSQVKYKDSCTPKYWNKEPKNSDIWYRIHQVLLMHVNAQTQIYCKWVKGHANNKGNEMADSLANTYYTTVK